MKRLLVLLLTAMMLLAGCSSEPAPAETPDSTDPSEPSEPSEPTETKMTAGTYSSVGTGFKGDIKVDVTVTEDEVTEIEVVEHTETNGIGSEALLVLVDNVVKYQTAAVDSVAGATVTSNGFKTAVKDALTQAGADMGKFNATAVKGELKDETIDADVVVVGAGAAGMMSALYIAKEGYSVVLLEKTPMVGGASAMAGGTLAATNSQWQKDAGYEDSSEMLKERLLAAGHNKNHLPTVELYASIIGPNFDWIVSEEGGEMPYKNEGAGASFSYDGGGAGAMLKLKENLENAGVEILLSTEATELIVEGDAVVGVKATGEEANYTVNARSVILATGGYGNNRDLVPEEYFAFRYSGHSGHNGDALEMIKAVDGATRNLTWLNKQPNTMILPSGAPQYTNMGVNAVYKMSGILINENAERFAHESGDTWELMLRMEENERQYLLMDQENYEAFNEAMANRNIFNADDPDKWTADDYEGQPVYKGADTLEELAEKIDVPVDALKETVAKYNEAVTSGSDDEFGRELTTTIAEDGRYYALELSIRYSTSLGGIQINDKMQVLNTSEVPVEGLYAAGEVVGGVQGDLYLPSSTFTWAMTSGVEAGRVVSEALAE